MLSWIQRQVGQFAFAGTMAGKAILAPVALGAHAMLVTPEGKVVLARHSYKSGWSFPGGGVGRAEAPVDALLRELREEIGVVRSDPPLFFGLYTRRSGWATNVIALYCLTNAEVEFRPNFEVREIVFADPVNLPKGTSAGTARRLAEFFDKTPPNPYW
jgi:8-oxo-dGTP pyrophosphatase MutT (NUDIX family)